MVFLLYRNGEPWGMPQELTRAQVRDVWAHRNRFGRQGVRQLALSFTRARGRAGFYFECNGRTYNLILDARPAS